MAAPKQNSNAQKWTEKKVILYLNKMKKAAGKPHNLFLGKQLVKLKLYKDIWCYWKKRFANYESIMEEMTLVETLYEINLFNAALRGDVPAPVAISSLRNAHHWRNQTLSSEETAKGILKVLRNDDQELPGDVSKEKNSRA